MQSERNDSAVFDGIMLWVGAVILIILMLPVVNGVVSATPTLVSSPWANQSGTYSPYLNSSQVVVNSAAANSFNLIGITPIVIAAVVVLGAVALLGFRRNS